MKDQAIQGPEQIFPLLRFSFLFQHFSCQQGTSEPKELRRKNRHISASFKIITIETKRATEKRGTENIKKLNFFTVRLLEDKYLDKKIPNWKVSYFMLIQNMKYKHTWSRGKMSVTNLMNPPGLMVISLPIKIETKKWERKLNHKKTPISRESYFNMAPRTMTPNRLSPPNPMTIALSDALVLLQTEIPCVRELDPKTCNKILWHNQANKKPELPFFFPKILLDPSNPICPSFTSAHVFLPTTSLRRSCTLKWRKSIHNIALHRIKSISQIFFGRYHSQYSIVTG